MLRAYCTIVLLQWALILTNDAFSSSISQYVKYAGKVSESVPFYSLQFTFYSLHVLGHVTGIPFTDWLNNGRL